MAQINGKVDDGVDALLSKVIKSENIENAKFEIQKGCEKGDGYMSVIYVVKIVGDNKNLNVIVKVAPTSKEFRKQTHTVDIYFHEAYFYDTIFPAFLRFQQDKCVENPFTSTTRCYATALNEFREGLVLENLKNLGYQMFDRRKAMDPKHVSFVLTQYAHFHAISFAMKDQNLEHYQEITGKLCSLFDKFSEDPKNADMFKELSIKTRIVLDPQEDEIALKRYDMFCNSSTNWLDQMRGDNMDPYSVLVHGDCWTNNLMFKYEDDDDEDQPTSIRVLDWQMIRTFSPVVDIVHFFYVCSSNEVISNHKHYMQIYYDALSKQIRNLGSDPEKLYPRLKFEEHWKRYSCFGLAMCTMMLRIMMSEKEEIPDMVDLTDAGQNFLEILDIEPKDKYYRKRMREIILHFVDNDYI